MTVSTTPHFDKVLKEKMDELGLSCEVVVRCKRLGGGTPVQVINFLKEHLGVPK